MDVLSGLLVLSGLGIFILGMTYAAARVFFYVKRAHILSIMDHTRKLSEEYNDGI